MVASLCIGRKMEDGNPCSASRNNSNHCKHHTAIFEFLYWTWWSYIQENMKKVPLQHRLDLATYVRTSLRWIMGWSNEKPWYYPRIAPRYDETRDTCMARSIATGKRCQNEPTRLGICKSCEELRKILHSAYHVAEKNDPTSSYCEFFLREEYTSIFRMYSDDGHCERHIWLSRDMLEAPYPTENVPHFQSDIIFKYVKPYDLASKLNYEWQRKWYAVKGFRDPTIPVDDDGEYHQDNVTDEEEAIVEQYDEQNDDQYDELNETSFCSKDLDAERSLLVESEEDWDQEY